MLGSLPGNLTCLNSCTQDVLWTSDLSLTLGWKTCPLLKKCYLWGSLTKGPKLHLFSFFLRQLRLAFNLQKSCFGSCLLGITSVLHHVQTYSWEVGKRNHRAEKGLFYFLYGIFQDSLTLFFITKALPSSRS